MSEKNYTKPNDDQHIDKPNDWLFGSLLFARTLAFTIPEGYGVIIDLQEDMIDLYPYSKRVVVAHIDSQVAVYPGDTMTNLNEGDVVLLADNEDKEDE